MTPAEQEAYANADDTRITLYTLELNHPGFTQPLRIVSDNNPLTADTEEEEGVLFTPFYFSLKRPPINEEPDPTLSITVDNVSGFMTPYLDAASRSGESITLIFRPYLIDYSEEAVESDRSKVESEKLKVESEKLKAESIKDDSDFQLSTLNLQPSVTLLRTLSMAIRNATANMTSVTLTAAHVNPANLPFPKELYTSDRFPGLV